MSEWKEYRIGDLCLIGDGAHASIKRVESGVLYMSSKNLKREGLNLSTVDYISNEDYEKHFRLKSKAITRPVENDVILAIIGSIGSTYVVKSNDIFGLSSSVAIIRPNEKLYSEYLHYFLKSELPQKYIESIQGGSAQGFLSLEMIKSIPIRLPDFQIQQKIANILGTYDELIEINNERIKILEETAQSLYKEWFVRFRFPNYQHTEFIKGVPKGWEVGNIYDLAEVKGGGTPSTINEQYWNGDIPFYTPTDFDNNFFIFETEKNITDKGLNNSSTKIFPKRTTFITARGTVGNICIAANEMAMNQSCFAILPHNFENYAYLFLFVGQMVNFFKQVSTGATFDAFNLSTFKNYEVVIPEKKLISKFSDFVNPIFTQIENLQQQNTELRQIRDRLLPRLISGKLVV